MVAAAAVAALAMAMLAGCADDSSALAPSPPAPTSSTSSSPAGQQPGAARQPANAAARAHLGPLEEAVQGALLTEADVALEGVAPVGQATPLRGCLTEIPVGLIMKLRAQSAWRYPTGSALDQLVTAYPDRPAATVFKQRVSCGGEKLKLDDGLPVDLHAAWCEGTSCTVVLTGGKLLSATQVTAGKRKRAAEAITRLAPIAAARLASANAG